MLEENEKFEQLFKVALFAISADVVDLFSNKIHDIYVNGIFTSRQTSKYFT